MKNLTLKKCMYLLLNLFYVIVTAVIFIFGLLLSIVIFTITYLKN
jgi:hypothetical protein